MTGSVLVVDDDAGSAELVCELLRRRGFEAAAVSSGSACLDRLQTHPADVVMTDVWMPGMSGIALCGVLRDRHPGLLPIVVTGRGDLETAIDALRAGAYDFITKPVSLLDVDVAVSRALAHLALEREVARLRTDGCPVPTVAGITGDSPVIRALVAMLQHVAGSDAAVLLTGETGTGKELAARALHDLSPRRDQPFVAVNCAAMPASLLESELFGHVRGAFTDAKHDRHGLFVTAGSGTVLLDEIGDMPPEMQVKLLRVLQSRTVRPVGSDREIPFAARVITSTHRDLEADVAAKRFREDLFYRIDVVHLVVPPLRARGTDILWLAQHFIDRAARRSHKPVRGLSVPAARVLVEHDWPGNVRELENYMERAVALCRLDEITIDDLPDSLRASVLPAMIPIAGWNELVTMHEMERRYVDHVLESVDGNKAQAARILGIDRRSLYRRLDRAAPPS